MFKNRLIILMSALILLFASCTKNTDVLNNDDNKKMIESKQEKEKLKIVATTFPQYDWIREIAGDKLEDIELTLLLDSGVDLHSYSPTADDIIKIKEADLFVFVGGHSDEWVHEVLEAGDSDVELFNMMEELGFDMDHDHEHGDHDHEDGDHDHEDGDHDHEDVDHDHEDGDHDHEDVDHDHEDGDHDHEDGDHDHEDGDHDHEDGDHDHEDGDHDHEDGDHDHEDGDHDHEDGDHDHEDGDHDHEDGDHDHEDGDHDHEEHNHADEHVWLSLKHASTLSFELASKMGELDPENKDIYEKNAKAYSAKLDTLDKEYEHVVQNASIKTVLFADRFPFDHMFDDYGIENFSAFSGCSAESEASFETIAFLSDKVSELELSTVMTLENSDKKLAETIIETSGKEAKILEMDSMQSITKKRIDEGAKYLEIMKKNAEVLEEALNN